MSEHMFGVSRKKLNRKEERKIQKIAEKHGASFTSVTLPGTGHQSWFACPNLGHPFDGETARAVLSEIESEGIDYFTNKPS